MCGSNYWIGHRNEQAVRTYQISKSIRKGEVSQVDAKEKEESNSQMKAKKKESNSQTKAKEKEKLNSQTWTKEKEESNSQKKAKEKESNSHKEGQETNFKAKKLLIIILFLLFISLE